MTNIFAFALLAVVAAAGAVAEKRSYHGYRIVSTAPVTALSNWWNNTGRAEQGEPRAAALSAGRCGRGSGGAQGRGRVDPRV